MYLRGNAGAGYCVISSFVLKEAYTHRDSGTGSRHRAAETTELLIKLSAARAMEDDGDVPARGRVRMLIRETQRCLPPCVCKTGKGGNAGDQHK